MVKLKTVERLLTAAGFACALFLFLPLVVYLLNPGSVTTPKVTILLSGMLLTVVITCILAVMMAVPCLGNRINAFCQAGLLTLVVLTVFPNHTGEMSGFKVTQTSPPDILAFVKLLVVIGTVSWLAWRKPQILRSLSRYALIVVLLITGFIAVGKLSATDRADLRQLAQQAEPAAVFTQLGSGANVIIVIFDAFTGYRMTELLNEHPELRDDLAGFVHYPAALASAISTPSGVSAIITGDLKISLKDEDDRARTVESLKSSVLADAGRLGFSTGFISHLNTSGADIPCRPETSFFNQQQLDLLKRLPSYLGFFTTSLTRIVPRSIATAASKSSVLLTTPSHKSETTDWDLLQSLQSEMDRRPQAAKMAMNYFINNLTVVKKNGSVLVLHSMLSHPPYKLAADGHYEQGKDNEYEGQSLYAVKELARLCARLHALGVYDSTLLIAVADHGAMPVKDVTVGGKFSAAQFRPEQLYFNPLLMVKAPGAVGPCRQSAMTVWLGDVAATVRDFLGVSGKTDALFATRSLLQPELRKRTLDVPIFFRSDQVNYYAPLSKWVRQDVNGEFSDYAAAIEVKPVNLLQKRAKVTLFSGVDQLQMQILKSGWGKGKGKPYRATIEANGRLVAKLDASGIAVVTEDAGGYQTNIFPDPAAAEAFLRKITPDRDRLSVGLQVPSEFVGRLFPQLAGTLAPKTPVGFVSVSGPSYGPVPKVLAGSDELRLEFPWKLSPKE